MAWTSRTPHVQAGLRRPVACAVAAVAAVAAATLAGCGATVRSATPGVTVRSATPGVTVRSATPGVTVRSATPGVTVRSATPGVTVRSATVGVTRAARPTGRCRGQPGRVVLRGPRVTITVASLSGVGGYYRACLRATGPGSTINAAGEYEPVMPGPALATAGAWVAAAVGNDTDPNLDFMATRIVAIDLADGRTRYVDAAGDGSVAKVLKTIVRADGSVAWSACTIDEDPPTTRTGPGSACWAPGHPTWVYVLQPGARAPRLLDYGRQITGHSLTLADGRLSWTDAGRSRSAALHAVS
jgi:hypothetical protein